ncbi:FxsA family protein [Corynebacterium sp. sy039]|uniref:FxsA family protein n=1 Tax=Corynebacterium sp. sy039 TaxID=2599641 RepID=UPI001FF063F4|nr:FxsA family protein [Corynebacterium sp. sy039]
MLRTGTMAAMPLIIPALVYIVVESVVFWLVAHLIGTGWALLLLIAFFFLGLILATMQMRSIAARLAHGKATPGKALGNLGLVAAGCVFITLPGFVSSAIGFLLINSGTRSVIQTRLSKKMRKKIEDLGMRGFEATNQYRQRSSYGYFADTHTDAAPSSPSEEDETSIRIWSQHVDPDDFKE